MLFAHCWQDPMTMAPALPGVCGDAKRVADNCTSEITALWQRSQQGSAAGTCFLVSYGTLAPFCGAGVVQVAYEQAYVQTRGAHYYWTECNSASPAGKVSKATRAYCETLHKKTEQ